MKEKISRFFSGIQAVFDGTLLFWQTPRLWGLALIPFILLLIAYALMIWGGIESTAMVTEKLRHVSETWPQYLQWLIVPLSFMLHILGALVIILIFIFCSGTLYETLGGMFFDKIVEKLFAEEKGEFAICRNSWLFEVKGIVDALLYTLGTLAVALGALVLYLLPMAGAFLWMILISYRLGVFYMALGALRFGRSFADSRTLARKNMLAVTGYGLAVYTICLIPLVPLVMLPGIIIGGVLLQKSIIGHQKRS